jgi:hypothetical protein
MNACKVRNLAKISYTKTTYAIPFLRHSLYSKKQNPSFENIEMLQNILNAYAIAIETGNFRREREFCRRRQIAAPIHRESIRIPDNITILNRKVPESIKLASFS